MDKLNDVIHGMPNRPMRRVVESRPLPGPVRQPEYSCPVCKDMGFLRYDVAHGHPLFGKLAMCQCRQVDKARKTLSKTFSWLGSPPDLVCELESMTFASFQPQANGKDIAVAYRKARGYADALKRQVEEQKNGLFIGPLGVGKTHLVCAVLNEVRMAGVSCLFASGNELFQALFDRDFDESILKDAASTGVLCLDDMDKMQKKADGSYQKSTLFTLLNQRYVARKPTIITSNEDKEWREWMHPAVLSRLFGKCNVEAIAMPGRDYRMIGG